MECVRPVAVRELLPPRACSPALGLCISISMESGSWATRGMVSCVNTVAPGETKESTAITWLMPYRISGERLLGGCSETPWEDPRI